MKLRWLALVLNVGLSSGGQELPAIGDLSAPRPARPRDHVQYVIEGQPVLPAGRSGVVRLRFVVDEGFHINSHRPKGDLLVATELRLEPAAGVQAGTAAFPAGKPYRFAAAPDEELDVYTGPFAVELPVTAAAGPHTLKATLRYQACDQAMCYPARSLPVVAEFTAR